MRVSAKVDYAVRAAAELATAGTGRPLTRESIAKAQQIPFTYLEQILAALKHHGIVRSQRGSAKGGYWLARPADQLTLATIIRAVHGPLTDVRGLPPEALVYNGSAKHLPHVWVAVQASLHNVLDRITLADLVAGTLPLWVPEPQPDPLHKPDAQASH